MKEQIELLTDRVNDLESHLVDMQTTSTLVNSSSANENRGGLNATLFFIPLAVIMLMLMDLNIDYKTNNHNISYNNNGLIEIGLGAITLATSAYSIKKNHDS